METSVQYLQVLLFIAHKKQEGDSAFAEEGPAGAPPPLHRSRIILYALLPRIRRYDAVARLFSQNGIIVLTEKLSAFLLEAARSRRVELVELVVRIAGDQLVDPAGRLIVSTDPFNSKILPILVARHAVDETAEWSGGKFEKSFGSHFHRPLDDETNFNKILKTLIAAGPDIKHRHANGGTLLHFAVRNELPKLVALLVESGARVDARTNCGKTPLRLAIDMPVLSNAIISSLLEAGANVNAVGGDARGVSLFSEALRTLRHSRMDIIIKLLDKGGDVNAEAQFGSAVKLAAEAGPYCLSEILKRGPDLIRNRVSFREIFLRAGTGKLPASVVQMLHRYGFRLRAKDARTLRFLNAALILDRNIFEEYLKRGAMVHAEVKEPMNKLISRAIDRGDSEVCKYLLKIDDIRDNSFFCDVLSQATNPLQVGCVKAILKMGDLSLSCIFDSDVLKNLEPEDVGRQYGDNLKRQTRLFIAQYIVKVTAADLTVNKKFFASGQHFRKDELPAWVLRSVPDAFLTNCIAEVASLKAETVRGTICSYYDILNATVPEIVGLLRHPSILYNWRSRQDLDVMFPRYWPFIDFRFRKAEYRRTLIDQGVKIFGLLRHCNEVPFEIRERILTLLCNHELLMFNDVYITAADTNKSAPVLTSQGTA